MAEFRWIKTSLVLILVLQFTAAATGLRFLSVTVEDEVTLSCDNVIDDHENCNSTTWLFLHSEGRTDVVLVTDGKIVEEAKDKSGRLSVSENCSLVIKKVTDEDVGLYICRQIRSGRVEDEDAEVYLSVVTMTEHEDNDEVTLNCSVATPGGCEHEVKWLFDGEDVDKDIKTSQTFCFASLEVVSSHLIYTSRFNSLTCEVTDGDHVQQFPFRISPSGYKKGDEITTTTESTTTEDTTTPESTTTTASTTTTESTTTEDTTTPESTTTTESTTITASTTTEDTIITESTTESTTTESTTTASTTTEETTTTESTTTEDITTTESTTEDTTTESTTTEDTTTTTTTKKTASTTEDTQAGWWRFIFVPVGLAAIIIIIIKEKKTQMDEVAVRYDGEDEAVNYDNITPADGV